MTDNLGTLAGLIEDLEGLHKIADWSITDGDDIRYCDHCEEDVGTHYGIDIGNRLWPCPTIELTRKHKRGQYGISDAKVYCYVTFRDGRDALLCSSKEAAEAWIEKQVNG